MGDYARMTVVVPEPMAETIQAAIAAGEYASASEVVRDAMRLWNERRAHVWEFAPSWPNPFIRRA